MGRRQNPDGSFTVEVTDQSLWGSSVTGLGAGGVTVTTYYVAPGTISAQAGQNPPAAQPGTPGSAGPNGQNTPSNNNAVVSSIQSAFSGGVASVESLLQGNVYVQYALLFVVLYFAWKIGKKVLKAV